MLEIYTNAYSTFYWCTKKYICSGALTLQLLEQEGFSAAPLSVQTHTDGWLHGGFTKDVSQRAAVQVITQHVAITLRRGQVLYNRSGKGKEKTTHTHAPQSLSSSFKHTTKEKALFSCKLGKHSLAPKIWVRMLFWCVQSML